MSTVSKLFLKYYFVDESISILVLDLSKRNLKFLPNNLKERPIVAGSESPF